MYYTTFFPIYKGQTERFPEKAVDSLKESFQNGKEVTNYKKSRGN